MMNVAILLSTYNGEMFLKEQIDSIINQSFKNWDLYIRDDGSTDSTLLIIKKYCKDHHNIHLVEDNKNLGACQSFLWLLNYVDAPYYMFCDQDDIWLQDKIYISLELMKKSESIHPEIPILVHTDLKVVDKDLKEINTSFWNYAKLKQRYLSGFNYLGVCNGITGCSMMINDKTKKVSLPCNLKIPMHDYFLALKVAKFGKIVYLDTSTILYRQHDKNELGAKDTNFVYFLTRLKKLRETINNQLKVYRFLHELNYGSLLKFYWYKISYTIIRNI